MSVYLLVKVVHILAVVGLVGPLMLAPKWLFLTKHEMGRALLHDLHTLTGISGWIAFLSGGIMLWLQDGGFLGTFWMQFSIVLFLLIQAFDHFWADRREEELERGVETSFVVLKIWLILKLALYGLIASLMVLQI